MHFYKVRILPAAYRFNTYVDGFKVETNRCDCKLHLQVLRGNLLTITQSTN
jgi:hypothetical protein